MHSKKFEFNYFEAAENQIYLKYKKIIFYNFFFLISFFYFIYSIFRMTALIRADALHPNNLPLWYEVYKTFPPKYEPKYSRKPPTKEIQNIFYQEDLIRA